MRAWYDIFQFGGGAEDEAGIRASQKAVEDLIKNEKGRKIVLAGFSQGGAIVLQTALRHPERLAGLMALSTYLPLAATLAAERNPANQDVPIFMAHGTQDPVVPFALADESRQLLAGAGYNLEWHAYPMPHSLCPQEIADLRAWLRRTLVEAVPA